MKILALDTATKSCSVALTENGRLCAELTTLKDQTHSKHVMDLIHSVFEISGVSISDVDGFAVTIGPGSFTGLRIGISTIKGLAHAVGKPIVGISSLKALAWQCTDQNFLICPLLDARKVKSTGQPIVMKVPAWFKNRLRGQLYLKSPLRILRNPVCSSEMVLGFIANRL